MLANREIMAFLATTNPDRSKEWYTKVLGFRLTGDEPFALVFDLGGTMLRIQKAHEHTPPPFTLLGWKVPDIRAELAALRERGVTFERYDFLPADADGIWTAPDGTKVAWFKDPDGNTLSLTQFA
jgi:catechol 2,3-dioxygenase-like lactoylglutathione lyase family enzyme